MVNEYFGDFVAIVNLKKREDRLQSSTAILDAFGVNYEVWEATENLEYPCRGLVDSMQRYFKKVLDAGGERCLVFEDDIKDLVSRETFNETMDNCINQLPEDWGLFYLGCNVVSGISGFYSENILSLRIAYATHAVAYSRKAMEMIVGMEIKEPFDNYIVKHLQRNLKVFCSYPMLFTQKPDYSDINRSYTDWSRFLEVRFNSEIKRLKKC